MGGLKQIPIDDAIDKKEKEQQNEREKDAYKKGKERHNKNQKDPNNKKGPMSDGYTSMNDGEKEAYKKGHGGG